MDIENLGKNFYQLQGGFERLISPSNFEESFMSKTSETSTKPSSLYSRMTPLKLPLDKYAPKKIGLATIPERREESVFEKYFPRENQDYFSRSESFVPPKDLLAHRKLRQVVHPGIHDVKIPESFLNELGVNDSVKGFLMKDSSIPPHINYVFVDENRDSVPVEDLGKFDKSQKTSTFFEEMKTISDKKIPTKMQTTPLNYQQEPRLDVMRKQNIAKMESNVKNIQQTIFQEVELSPIFRELNQKINEHIVSTFSKLFKLRGENFKGKPNLEALHGDILSEFEKGYNNIVLNLRGKVQSLRISENEISRLLDVFHQRCEENKTSLFAILNAVIEIHFSRLLLTIEKERQIDELKKNNNGLYNEITLLKEDLLKIEGEKIDLKQKELYEKTLKDLENRDQKISSLNREIEAANRNVEEFKIAYDQLFNEKARIEGEYARENLSLSNKIEELKQMNVNLARLYENYPSQIEAATNEKEQILRAYNQNQQLIENYKNEYFQEKQKADILFQNLSHETEKNSMERERYLLQIRKNEEDIQRLMQLNEEIKSNARSEDQRILEFAELLGLNQNSQDLTNDMKLMLNDLLNTKNKVMELTKRVEKKDELFAKAQSQIETLREQLLKARSSKVVIAEALDAEKKNLEILAAEKMEIEQSLAINETNLSMLYEHQKDWEKAITALTIYVDDASERCESFFGDWISPLYDIFSKRNAILQKIKKFGETNQGSLNYQVPQSIYQELYPNSALAAFYQIYFSALLKNMENVMNILIFQYKNWMDGAGFVEDPFRDEFQTILTFQKSLDKNRQDLTIMLKNLKGDIDKNKKYLELGLQSVDNYAEKCTSLRKVIEHNRIKVQAAQTKLGLFLAKHTEDMVDYSNLQNIVINLYQLYLASSALNCFYNNIGHTYFSELLEILLIESKENRTFSELNPPYVKCNVDSVGSSVRISGYMWGSEDIKKLQTISTQLLRVTILQFTTSPLGILAKLKLMLRNYLISQKYGIGESSSFQHTFDDCFLLDLIFWKMKKIDSSSESIASCLSRKPIFVIGEVNHTYTIDSSQDVELLNDGDQYLTKKKVLIYFYDFLTKSLYFIIQKVHSEIYFATPNNVVITSMLELIEKSMQEQKVFEILKNLLLLRWEILKMLAVGLIKTKGVVNYTPLQENQEMVGAAIVEIFDKDSEMKNAVEKNKNVYSTNDYTKFLTDETPYKREMWRKNLISKVSPKCLPLVNYLIRIRKEGKWVERDVPLMTRQLQTKKIDYMKNRVPYEFLLDDLEIRSLELSDYNYENNRKFAYFMCFTITLSKNMAQKTTQTLTELKSGSYKTSTAKISDIYKNSRSIVGGFTNPLNDEKNRIKKAVDSQDMNVSVKTQKILERIIKKEVLEIPVLKIASPLPDLVNSEIQESAELYFNNNNEEESKIIDFISVPNKPKNERRFVILDVEKGVNKIEINAETANSLFGFLKTLKSRAINYTLKPTVEFAREVKKYITSSYINN